MEREEDRAAVAILLIALEKAVSHKISEEVKRKGGHMRLFWGQ